MRGRAPGGGAIDEAATKAWFIEQADPYLHPRHIFVVPEIPLAQTNKVDRAGLKIEAAERTRTGNAARGMTMSTTISILEKRRIEAEIIKPIFDELVARFGKDEAKAVIAKAVRENSIQQAGAFRAELGEGSGIDGFYSTLHLWTMNGALEIEVTQQSSTALDYTVHRCRYAEMYRELGLAEIGHLLSCQRDAVFCKGIDPRIEMERTQTIMEGADHCDFSYRLNEIGPSD